MIPEFNKGQEIYLEHMTRYIFSSQFVKDKVVLDIACGSGYGADHLLKAGAQKVVGVDISEETIGYCKEKYVGDKIEFFVGSVEKIPLEDKSVDVIVSFETIEHVNEVAQIQFLREVKRVLKSDGMFIVSTPNSLVFPKGSPFHPRELDPKEFEDILSKNFKHANLFYQDDIECSYIYSDAGLKQVRNTGGGKEINEKLDSISSNTSRYLIAICGDNPLTNITEYLGLSNIKPYEQLISEMKKKDDTLHQKDQEIEYVKQIILHKDNELESRDKQLIQKDNELEYRDKQLIQKDNELKSVGNELDLVKCQLGWNANELSEIHRSKAWRLILLVRKILVAVLPTRSVRRKIAVSLFRYCRSIFRGILRLKNLTNRFRKLVSKVLHVVRTEGLNVLVKKGLSYLSKRNCYATRLIDVSANVDKIANCLFALQQNELSRAEIESRIQGFPKKPLISIIMPVYNTPSKWLRLALDSIRNQIYSNWHLCIVDDYSTKNDVRAVLDTYARIDPRIQVHYSERNGGISAASNIAIGMSKGEYVALFDHDDELTKDALYWMVKEINDHPGTEFIYSDECKIDDTGKRKLFDFIFKPDWSPEMLINCMYTGHLTLYKKDLLNDLGCFRSKYDFSQDYDLALRMSEKAKGIRHVERLLYLWRAIDGSAAKGSKDFARASNIAALANAMKRRGVKATISGYVCANRAMVMFDHKTRVSIVIPSDSYKNLKKSIDSIMRRTKYQNYEIVIVSNSKVINDLKVAYGDKSGRLVYSVYDKKYNFSDKCNQGANTATGIVLVFLNDDVYPIESDWLENLIEFVFLDSKIGGVSPKLLSLNDTIQYAGMTVNANPFVGTFLNGKSKDGYLANVVRNTSILSGACLAIKKEVFLKVHGFDAVNTPAGHSDIDFSFKLRENGYRCVYTPYATLHHVGNHSWHTKKDKADIFVLNRWGKYISNDPYYTKSLRTVLEGYFPEQFAIYSRQSEVRKYSFDALIVIHELSYTGAPIVALNTVKAIINAGGYPVVLSYIDGPLRIELEKLNVSVVISALARHDEFAFKHFAKNFDVVIVNTVVAYPAVHMIQNIVPTIWFIHEAQSVESHFIPYYENARPSLLDVLKTTTATIYTASEYSRDSMLKYCKTVNILNLGIPDQYKSTKVNIGGKVQFSIVGTVEERKAQDIFIKAVLQLPKNYRNRAVFNIIGDDKSHNIFADKLKMQTNNVPEIIWHGSVIDQEKKLDLFVNTSVFVIVSRDEPTSIIVIEGAMLGKPSIISKNVGARYLIEEGKTGFIVETNDVDQLKNTFMGIIDNPQVLVSMGVKARKKYVETSTFDIFQDNLVNAVRSKLKNISGE